MHKLARGHKKHRMHTQKLILTHSLTHLVVMKTRKVRRHIAAVGRI